MKVCKFCQKEFINLKSYAAHIGWHKVKNRKRTYTLEGRKRMSEFMKKHNPMFNFRLRSLLPLGGR
jgi:hypothetical protein